MLFHEDISFSPENISNMQTWLTLSSPQEKRKAKFIPSLHILQGDYVGSSRSDSDPPIKSKPNRICNYLTITKSLVWLLEHPTSWKLPISCGFCEKRNDTVLYLPQLADEEDKHEPKERGCSPRAHQNDYLDVWLPLIAWKEKNCHKLPDHKKITLNFS